MATSGNASSLNSKPQPGQAAAGHPQLPTEPCPPVILTTVPPFPHENPQTGAPYAGQRHSEQRWLHVAITNKSGYLHTIPAF